MLEAGSELITEAHTFVTAYAAKRFRPSVAQAISIAAYELLENGLNYGSVIEPVVFELVGSSDPEIAVTNVAVGSRIAVLTSRVEALATDAEAIYLEELRRSMSGGAQRAMLGLARVMHEAKMRVSVELAEQRVTVRARAGR